MPFLPRRSRETEGESATGSQEPEVGEREPEYGPVESLLPLFVIGAAVVGVASLYYTIIEPAIREFS